ncbi:MAG: hypothetical protein ACKOCN_03530 [Planctomycetaceae bacterium]
MKPQALRFAAIVALFALVELFAPAAAVHATLDESAAVEPIPGPVEMAEEGAVALSDSEMADPLEEAVIEARLKEMVDAAVEAQLAGIPRPRYIPATDLVPPRGLLLLQNDARKGQFPFAMALGGYMQIRWFEFARGATEWFDAAGQRRLISNINTFNIHRFLLSFHGHVVDERMLYNFALFGTTNVGIRSGVVPIGQLGWKFDDAATAAVGMTQVPGSREWMLSSQWTVGVDRSMANTFFRPGFSPGALVLGDLADDTVHYIAGVWNAIDGGTTGVLRRGTSMAWVGNTWWEPWGPFGLGPADMEHRRNAVIRLGTSGVYAPTFATLLPGNNPEDTIVRLSDGTPLTLPGALGPDEARVSRYLYRLATVDAAWKWRGLGASMEYYFRMLDDFAGSGTFDRSSLFDHGGMGYLSWCFVPRTYEAYARSSVVTGPYGTGQEYGGGLNWYVNRSRQSRLTLEAIHMHRNPAQNFLYPYRAGYTGTAIQTQLMVIF